MRFKFSFIEIEIVDGELTILDMDDSLRGSDEIFQAKNGWAICSISFPKIYPDQKKVYVRGAYRGCDRDASVIEDSEISEVLQAFVEYELHLLNEKAPASRDMTQEEKAKRYDKMVSALTESIRSMEESAGPGRESSVIIFKGLLSTLTD